MPINDFKEELKKIGIILNDNQLNQLEQYYELLVEKNKVMNLTGIVEKEEVYLKHFYDSLTIVKSIDLNRISNLCDIGTGAGFPGLVLKIVFPQLKVVLLDSLNKRVDFLNDVINTLNLKNIEVIHTRAEEYALSHRNSFDVTTARAVANLSILLEYAIPMTKVGGYFIALKGNVRDELEDSKNALKELNTTFIDLCEFSLPVEKSIRSICKFQKNGDVKKYPRKYSEIKKRKL